MGAGSDAALMGIGQLGVFNLGCPAASGEALIAIES